MRPSEWVGGVGEKIPQVPCYINPQWAEKNHTQSVSDLRT